jgi:hypothetical protein
MLEGRGGVSHGRRETIIVFFSCPSLADGRGLSFQETLEELSAESSEEMLIVEGRESIGGSRGGSGRGAPSPQELEG